MDIVNYTEARKNFSRLMDRVCEDHEYIAITRRNGKPVVMMSLEHFNSYETTSYLLSTERNRERLMESVDNVRRGNYEEKTLLEINDEVEDI